jgi:hypothetical protein
LCWGVWGWWGCVGGVGCVGVGVGVGVGGWVGVGGGGASGAAPLLGAPGIAGGRGVRPRRPGLAATVAACLPACPPACTRSYMPHWCMTQVTGGGVVILEDSVVSLPAGQGPAMAPLVCARPHAHHPARHMGSPRSHATGAWR